jgi:two-component system, cell cycle sensor histidine kinase and response regulator CckA
MSNPERVPEDPLQNASPPVTHDLLPVLLRNIADIIVIIEEDAHIRWISAQVEKTLQWSIAELVGRNALEFIHPEDVSRAVEELTKTLEIRGEGVPSMLRFRCKDGDWVPLEIIANNQLNNPRLHGIVFTARDLRYRTDVEAIIHQSNVDLSASAETRVLELARMNAALRIENQERSRTERRLQQTISLLDATLDSTADGILVISNDRKVVKLNNTFRQMWRIPPEADGTDEHLLALAVEQVQDPASFRERVDELMNRNYATSFDLIQMKDGRTFERYSQPQFIEGKPVGRVWSFRDITRSKHLEEELRHSQKMEAVGRLAGGVAHDFNNLLMIISGYASQMLEAEGLPAEPRNACEQILATTRRAASLTRQLLAFSRKHPVSPAVADLNVIVIDMEKMLQRLLTDDIRLEIVLYKESLPILIDVSQLELAIMNLAINAQDAMPRGGSLTISTSCEMAAEDFQDLATVRSYAVLSVRDTGVGMPEEVRERIFEPFFTTKELGKGTGLGLSAVYSIVKRAEGHIDVSSEPHRGTIFKIRVPLAASSSSAVTHAAPEAVKPVSGGETILLAEDEAGIRAMTRVYLEGLGYRVLEAANGNDAIRIAQEFRGDIQLLLTDILMPGMRGDAVLRRVREERPNIRALFISGYADEEMMMSGTEILTKPFEFPELGQRIKAILRSPGEVAGAA